MDDADIEKLFLKIAGTTVKNSQEVRKVFSILVKSTLQYRDWMKEELSIVLTVEDVRVALDWLRETLQSKRLPKTENRIRLNLLKLWLDELKPFL